MSSKLFPTSVVGSMPRSNFVRDLINDPMISEADYNARMDAAVRYIIALQEHAGLDVVTDGEWRRKSYIGVIAELANGFDLGYAEDGRPWTIVVDRLSAKTPGFIAREVEFVRGITTKQIKATLPSPALLGERMWDPEKSKKAYPTRDEFVRDCVPVLQREMELLTKAGADIIQVDDPHLCLFVDPEVRAQYENPDKAADFAVDMTNAIISAAGTAKVAVHLCRRAGARVRGEADHTGGFESIVKYLNKLTAHHLTMEFTAPGAGDFEVFETLREDFEIGLGCVSVMPGQIDSPDLIAQRVRDVLQYVKPERITLNPDCGFAPGSGAAVSIDEAYQKLWNQVEAAEILRTEYA